MDIRHPTPRDDNGSLIIVLSVIMVLVTLASAISYRVIENQSVVVARQNLASGVSSADAGLADALFRLDQGTTGTGTGSYFCVKPSDANCVAASIPGAAGVSYVANRAAAATNSNSTCPQVTPSTQQYTISALGTINGLQGAVTESAVRCSKFPFALFGNSSLTFNGAATASLSTYDATRSLSTVPGNPNPNANGAVAIGSNGPITCNGSLGNNVTSVYYGTGGISSLSTSCGTPESFGNTYYLPPPQFPSSGICPNSGNIGSAFGYNTLNAGTYLCTTPITIGGLLNVTGTVYLYQRLDPSVYNSSTNDVTIKASSYVNDLADYCNDNPGACAGTPNLPNSEAFQLYSNGNGNFGNDNGPGYDFGGVVYAPQANLTQDGCKSHYYGALIINTLTCNGGPHLYVSYDSQLGSMYGNWTTYGYQQTNPALVTIP